jgi:hypothetical protein
MRHQQTHRSTYRRSRFPIWAQTFLDRECGSPNRIRFPNRPHCVSATIHVGDVTNNIFYFDRRASSTLSFHVNQGCADACGQRLHHRSEFSGETVIGGPMGNPPRRAGPLNKFWKRRRPFDSPPGSGQSRGPELTLGPIPCEAGLLRACTAVVAHG